MADKSSIEWTDATWNPIRGCSRVSEGCRHCYAEGVAARFSGPGLPYEGLAKRVTLPGGGTEARWTGKVAFAGDAVLLQPLHWRKPRRIFVNSMSDLFHESVPDETIDRIFAVMALCPQHTFQILTKRPERMRDYFAETWQVPARPAERFMDMDIPAQAARTEDRWHRINLAMDGLTLGNKLFDHDRFWTSDGALIHGISWPHGPLPNVWLGVSVEKRQEMLDRGALLKEVPADIRFWSAEPLLGALGHVPLDIMPDWVIVGGESGQGARPMHPDWARSLRDQCTAAGVPFFFKQWGEWESALDRDRDDPDWRADYSRRFSDGGSTRWLNLAGGQGFHGDRFHVMRRVGKKFTGRVLDSRTHDEFPS